MKSNRFFRRRQWDAERSREIEAHLQIETDENMARGLSPEEARYAARRKLGNPTLIREEIYLMNSVGFLESFWQDLRYGMRALRLNAGFAAVALLSLALGIGANTAIFQLLDAVRLRMLPVSNPQQLAEVRLPSHDATTGNFFNWHSELTNALWEQIRDRQQAFSGVFAWAPDDFNLAPRGEVHLVHGIWVSGAFFSVLGVQPILGRTFTAADDQRGCGSGAGVVVSYAFWQRELGGDPSAIGRQVTIDYHPVEVLGVTPAGFFGLDVGSSFDLALPICSQPVLGGEDNYLDTRYDWWLTVMGRLKPGWTLDKATAYLGSISPGVFEATLPPGYDSDNVKTYLGFKLAAYPAGSGVSSLRQQSSDPLVLLLAITGLVLLIACANLANLMLARASAREREIAVRLALGASRGRLVRQLLSESCLLAAAGAAAGLLLARTLAGFMVAFMSTQGNAVFLNLNPDRLVFAFTAGLATVATVLFGLVPALRATRVPPVEAMKSGSRGMTANRERFGLRRVLVISQVALSLVLLVGALLFSRSLRNLLTLDLGFQRTGMLVTDLDLTPLKLPTARREPFKHDLLERLRSTPGVDSAAETYVVPTSGAFTNRRFWMDTSEASQAKTSWFNRVSPDFFKTMGTTLLAGRDFNDRDTPASPKVAIVNEAFAREIAGGANPIGRRAWEGSAHGKPQAEYEIVGLVKNTKYQDIREDFSPIVYLPTSQDPEPDPSQEIVIRSHLPLSDLTSGVKRAVAQANPDISIEFRVLQTMIHEKLLRERLMATLSGFFGFLAALLAIIGLYGVMSYMVVRRTNEIGIRMTLGAGRGEIVAMIVREAGMLLAIGLVVGIALSLAAGRAASSMLFGLKSYDPVTLALGTALLAVVAVAASYLPARRAANLDPMAALREE
ncbi:MAG TPA: ABC transporter permease [Terriglobia bacterium]|jgi:predicted permease|nr:ABC transporter permease [Terriglobia bacterium]